jgi:hypothetical protein
MRSMCVVLHFLHALSYVRAQGRNRIYEAQDNFLIHLYE